MVTINGSTTIALTGDIVELPTVPSPQVPASCEGSAKAVAGARFNRDLQVLGRELASGARGREFEPPAPTKQTNKLAFEPQALRGERYAVGSIGMCASSPTSPSTQKRWSERLAASGSKDDGQVAPFVGGIAWYSIPIRQIEDENGEHACKRGRAEKMH